MFRYLRNRYAVDKKKIGEKKVSGAGAKDVEEAKVNTSDLYAFMTWLDPYVKPRKTKTNLINVDANEVEEEDEELAENVESHEERR